MPERVARKASGGMGPRLLLGLILGCLLLYLSVTSRAEFNSDVATQNIVAAEILRTGSLVPPQFTFRQNVWLLHNHLVILALSPIVGTGWTAHVVATFVLAALLLAMAAALARLFELTALATMAVLMWFAAGISPPWVEHVYAQGSYGWLSLLVGLALAAGITGIGAGHTTRGAALAALTFFLGGLYGLRGAVTFLAPLAAGVLVRFVVRRERPPFGAAAMYLIAAVAGLAVRAWLIRGADLVPLPATPVDWREFSVAPLGLALADLFGLIGEGRFETLAGPWMIAYPLRWIAALLLLAGVGMFFAGLRRSSSGAALVLAGFLVCIAAIVTAGTLLVDEFRGVGRYYVPVAFVAVFAWAIALDRIPPARRLTIVTGAGVLLLALSVIKTIEPITTAAGFRGLSPASHLDPLIDRLEERGGTLGYATFWNSTAVSVLSNGRVNLRPILYQDGLPRPFHHLSSRTWYSGQAGTRTALVFDRDRDTESPLDEARLAQLVGPPASTTDVGTYRVLIYPHDVLSQLEVWQVVGMEAGTSSAISARAIEVQHEPNVGVIEDAALVAREGRDHAGAIAFGPYVRLRAGRYRVTIDVAATGTAAEPAARWDVVAGNAPPLLAQGNVTPGGRHLITTEVVIDQLTSKLPVEVRVFYSGTGLVTLYGRTIARMEEAR